MIGGARRDGSPLRGPFCPAHIARSQFTSPLGPCLRAVGDMLDPDRISGSCFLAHATERQSGRALSQRCEKVLRFPTVRPLPRFRVSLPASSPERFAGTVYCVPQMAPRLSWLVRQVLPNQRTLTCEKRRLRPTSSRRMRKFSMTSSFSGLRAVLASALPCSDEYAVACWGPQTLRPARDWLLDAQLSFMMSLLFSSRPRGLWASLRHPAWKGLSST